MHHAKNARQQGNDDAVIESHCSIQIAADEARI
jgi:hypothetical protein